MSRIYLDNAATSWPKPPEVYDAVDQYQRHNGAPAGRGVYAEAMAVGQQLEQLRHAIAQLIRAHHAREILFTYSGTDSLNMALHGLLRPGDHVVTSVWEHNSVLRPLHALGATKEITVSFVDSAVDAAAGLAEQVAAALRPSTRLVVLTHASNVTGALQPLSAVGQLLKDHPAMFLVDAAQTVGHLPLDVTDLGCDLLAAPGHKGLLGPTGTGFLYVRQEVQAQLAPYRWGGTGEDSDSEAPPLRFPSSYEAGNLNVPGLIGLHAGVRYLGDRGVDAVHAHEQSLSERLRRGLEEIPECALFSGRDPTGSTTEQLGVVSFQLAGYAPQELAILLDQAAGIQVRAGFHCAPRAHRHLKTDQAGGTVRVSFGPFNQPADVDTLLEICRSLVV